MADKLILDEEQLKKINGGKPTLDGAPMPGLGGYKLYLRDKELDCSKTIGYYIQNEPEIAALAERHPELSQYSYLTLNTACALLGQENLQKMIDEETGYVRTTDSGSI